LWRSTPDDISGNYPCGFDHKCFLEIDSKCKKSCSNDDHYEAINGICKLKHCNQRNVNDSDTDSLKCGGGEYYVD
jgi:hypothetical protein